MNDTEKAVEELKRGIKVCVESSVKNASFDKTFSALIGSVNGDGTYNIILNNQSYPNVYTNGGTCELNEIVKVCIPLNNMNNMYIDKGSSGGGTPYVLPIASNTTLGGIKIGNGLRIDNDGVVTVLMKCGTVGKTYCDGFVGGLFGMAVYA